MPIIILDIYQSLPLRVRFTRPTRLRRRKIKNSMASGLHQNILIPDAHSRLSTERVVVAEMKQSSTKWFNTRGEQCTDFLQTNWRSHWICVCQLDEVVNVFFLLDSNACVRYVDCSVFDLDEAVLVGHFGATKVNRLLLLLYDHMI